MWHDAMMLLLSNAHRSGCHGLAPPDKNKIKCPLLINTLINKTPNVHVKRFVENDVSFVFFNIRTSKVASVCWAGPEQEPE